MKTATRFIEEPVVKNIEDFKEAFINKRNWAVLELATSVTFGMNVGNFLELERTFERNRICRIARSNFAYFLARLSIVSR